MIDYCVQVVDHTMAARKENIASLAKEVRESQMPTMSDRTDAGNLAREQRREQALLYSDEVKVRGLNIACHSVNLGLHSGTKYIMS